jgi:hypothetical protein
MKFQFIEVSASAVDLNPGQINSENDGFVYEHLRHFLSKSVCLPAIAVKAADGVLVSVARHKYLAIARELGRERIRAVLEGETFEELKAKGVPGLLSVVSKEVLEAELADEAPVGWHVFFFKSRPAPETAALIEARFRGFLIESLPGTLPEGVRVLVESHFDFSGPCLEIRFPTPVHNHAWANSYLALISSVSKDILPVDTYQGRRFAS